MLNSRILLSLASVTVAGALLVGATFAFFTDTGSSTDNVFASGTFDLHIADENEPFQDSVEASTVSPADWAPGESFQSFLCFKNNGSIDIQEIIFSTTAIGGDADFRDNIIAEKVELGAATEEECEDVAQITSPALDDYTVDVFIPRFDLDVVDGKVSLSEILNHNDGTDRIRDDLLNRPAAFLPPDGIVKFVTTWTFDESAPGSAAGQSVNVTETFTANQDEVDEDTI